MKGYDTAYGKLEMIIPEEIYMSIVITKEKNGDDKYIHVSGLHNNPKNEEENNLEDIDLTPWRK